MRIRSVDFFERFRGWGRILTHRYTISRFGNELGEFIRGLTEMDALQCTLTKGRSKEGVYYYVHWRKLQVHLESDTDEDSKLIELPGASASGWHQALCGETSRVGVTRVDCVIGVPICQTVLCCVCVFICVCMCVCVYMCAKQIYTHMSGGGRERARETRERERKRASETKGEREMQ